MNSQFRPVWSFCVLALALFLMGATYNNTTSPFVPNLPVPKGGAMIFNPGNGDYAGFRIVVAPDGRAISVDGAGRGSTELQSAIVQKFFTDLSAASPLASLPSSGCTTKPADPTPTVEVNMPLVIAWKGDQTPTLSCASDPRAIKLLLDATTIQRAMYVQAFRKRTTLANSAYGASASIGYGYSGSYGASGGGYQYGMSSNDQFYFQPFTNGAHFSAETSTFDSRFDSGKFDMGPSFDSGNRTSSFQWASPAWGNPSFGSIPYNQPLSGMPTTSTVPNANPYSSSAFSGGPVGNSPFSSGPYGGLPMGNGPTVTTHP